MSDVEPASSQQTVVESTWEHIASRLGTFCRPFPADAVALAEAYWETVSPRLLAVLEQAAADQELVRDGEYMLHLYAMFLLAQHREARAFAPLLRIATHPQDVLEDMLGDTLTEGFGRCLASTCIREGDREGLRLAALDEGCYLFARGAALQALLTLVMEGDLELDVHRTWLLQCGEIEASRLKTGQGGDGTFLAMAVADLADLGAAPALDRIRSWYGDGLVDETFISLKEVETDARLDSGQLRSKVWHEHYVRSTTEEMGWWYCFTPESAVETEWDNYDDDYPEPFRRETPKIGRNDPCPCGSGKKYKKCCGTG